MKHVQKNNEPLVFSDWKALANEDWHPTYDDLSGETKKAVKKALMQEQGYLCCYCERQIDDDDSHIEPFLEESLSADDLQQFVSGYLRQDNSGRFGEFWTTIHYLFGEAVVA